MHGIPPTAASGLLCLPLLLRVVLAEAGGQEATLTVEVHARNARGSFCFGCGAAPRCGIVEGALQEPLE